MIAHCDPELQPMNGTELGSYLKLSRSTVSELKRLGYQFEYGFRTTPKHCRAWMKANASKLGRRPKGVKDSEGNPITQKKKAATLKLESALSAMA